MGGKKRAGCGCFGLGSVCAAILSWALNHSVGWAILHFFLGWIYVIWAVFVHTPRIVPALRALFGV